MSKIFIYDTTLRDGSQAEEIEFSLEDKLAIARLLDEMGVAYIEGGYPAPSNTKDLAFYRQMRKQPLKNATLVAFGSTRRAKYKVAQDPAIQVLLDTGAPAVAIVGKTWDLHVQEVLRISSEENLRMIRDSVAYLKLKKKEVLFDAEHFYDAYLANPDYAMKVLEAAASNGADWLVLCDTNGGTMSEKLETITTEVRRSFDTPVGIHAHNDTELAVANSMAAVRSGAAMVQGTMNGYGERCGNANLCSLIPNLQIKMKKQCIAHKKLRGLNTVARTVAEIANVPMRENSAYVGLNAFAHKGGLHVDAVRKTPVSYEHVPPESVGNERRIIMSEQSGVASVIFKAQAMGLELKSGSDEAKKIIESVKKLEHLGYKFEGADGSFRLLAERSLKERRSFYDLDGFRVIVENCRGALVSEATIKLSIKGKLVHTAAEGDGPVNAMDNALRKALEPFYPNLRKMHLVDFKVRVLGSKTGTAARVRVFIESQDEKSAWGTVGVSTNIIEASWEALVDAFEYKLHSDRKWR
ncbi:citramalate synthase [bacterium]|nr:citramalate synthase [bacterium]